MAACGMALECSEEQWQGKEVEPPLVTKRRSANYQPSIWDYDSICLPSTKDKEGAKPQQADNNHLASLHVALIETVRQLLLDEKENLLTRLRTVDQLQSLSVAYHFEKEIKSFLLFLSMQNEGAHHHDLKDDLSSAALLFRILRGHGVPSSTDMLGVIGDRSSLDTSSGNPKGIDGLLGLYEASFLGFPGEAALDQARTFAVENLTEMQAPSFAGHGPSPREKYHLPLHWRTPRLQAIWLLKQCFGDNQSSSSVVDPSILKLATIDFNHVQASHRRELGDMTRWWKESGLGEKLTFARDRVVECFFCATCIAPEPHLAECREVLAKVGSLIVHLDDIYDVYGTLDELEQFTDAIGRWCNVSAGATLPEYMKAMYSTILTTSGSAASRVLGTQGYDVLPLYMNGWHELCKAFLVEAQWQRQGYIPSFEEYLSNGWVTSTGPLLLLHALPTITQDQHHILSNNETERGDAPSSIACYMREMGVGEEEARTAVECAIAETWKELNREIVAPTDQRNMDPGSAAGMANLCLNLARIIHCIYLDGDGITSPTDHMKQLVRDLLFDPIPIHSRV